MPWALCYAVRWGAAVGLQDLTGDVGVDGQKHDGLGDVVGGGDAPYWEIGCGLFEHRGTLLGRYHVPPGRIDLTR